MSCGVFVYTQCRGVHNGRELTGMSRGFRLPVYVYHGGRTLSYHFYVRTVVNHLHLINSFMLYIVDGVLCTVLAIFFWRGGGGGFTNDMLVL